MTNLPQELILHTGSLRLAAQAWGPEQGQPVLALHGWLDNAASFAGLAPLLNNIRLLALDLPGHGCSEHRHAGAHYHFIDYLDDVIAVVEALGWKDFSLLGHSLGAGVASFVAAIIPQQVTKLALIEGFGPLSGDTAQTLDRLKRVQGARRRLADKRLPVYPDITAAAQARQRATGLGAQAAQWLAERGTKTVTGGVSWRSDSRLTQPSPLYLSEQQVRAVMSGITAPTLLIRGRQGLLWERPTMLGRYPLIANLEIADLDGGHHLHMETPWSCAEVLNAFLGN